MVSVVRVNSSPGAPFVHQYPRISQVVLHVVGRRLRDWILNRPGPPAEFEAEYSHQEQAPMAASQ